MKVLSDSRLERIETPLQLLKRLLKELAAVCDWTGRRLCIFILHKSFFAALLAVFFANSFCFAQDGPGPELTAEEHAFLEAHPRIRVGVGLAFPPFQYVEKEGGELVFKGMTSDYLALLSNRLGVEFSPVMDIPFDEALARGRRGEIDAYACIAKTPERAEFLLFTDPYLEYPLVIISRDDSPFIGSVQDLKGKRVAITPTLAHYSLFLNDYPELDFEFLFQPDVPSEIAAVALGQADACVANLAVVGYLIKKNGWSNLRVAAPSPWKTNPLGMAVRGDWPMFRDILQKALDSISHEEHYAISQRWIHLTQDQGLNWTTLWRILLPTAGVVTMALLLILSWNRSLAREIRRRKEAEVHQRESTRRYRELFENSRDGFVVVDIQGRFLDANGAYCALLGYSPDELRAKEDFYAVTPERWREWEQNEIWNNRLLKTGASGVYNKEYIRKDGTIFPVELQSFIVKNEQGDVLYLWGVARDVTERRQAEEALRKSEERYRTILNEMSEGYHEVDLAGNFTFFNETFHRLFGYSREEMMGTNFSRYAAEEAAKKKIYRAYKELFKTGVPIQNGEWEIIRKDSKRRTLQYYASVVKNLKGIPIGFRGIVRDITGVRQAEAEREKLRAQLSQARKMESVGRLAGGVAHDFNNMLGVILGHVEFALKKARENQDLWTNLEGIQTAARRSADLTRQLLTFARKQIIAPRPLDLNDTVGSMLNMLRRLIGEGIDLVWQPVTRPWPVKMDASQIDQILVNLCVNARDAIAGVGKLSIETGKKTFDAEYCGRHPGFLPGDFVLLAVSDNGSGMDKETLDNLFEPFFTTKAVGQGTGLGLATVYGIVKQNNGFINVYSEPGRGATFNIYLPRLFADDEAAGNITGEKPAASGDETILLVEDEPMILEMTTMMLQELGYTVLAAPTPGEAIRLAQAQTDPVHLLITDVVMPEMNGRDLAAKITGLHPGIRLLFMSGYTADIIAHQGVLDEGVTFIQKPFSMADMAEKLREVLDTVPDKNYQ